MANKSNFIVRAGLTVNTTATVGTSVTSPVFNSGTNSALQLQSNGALAVYVDTSQNVGIGTTAPGALLELSAANANVYSGIRLTNTTGTGTTPGVAIEWARGGTVKSSIQVNTFGNDYMAFCVNGNTERMRIDSSGNLLVGRTNTNGIPSGSTKNIQIVDDISAGSLVIGSFGSFLGRQASDGSTVLNTGQAAIIFSRGAYGSTTESARIDGSGNVGIGTSSPGFKFEVVTGGYNNGIHLKDPTSTVYGGLFVESSTFSIRARSNSQMMLATNDTARMFINPSGIITTPNQPAFCAVPSTATHTTNAGSVLDFGNVVFDRASNWNNTSYRFTAPVAGVYAFYCQIYEQNSASNKSLCWRKNGAQLAFADNTIMFQGGVNIGEHTLNGMVLLALASGDYVDVAVRNGASNLQWYGGHSWIFGYLLG